MFVPAIREKKPLIHCISNIVTANDCANLLLALGASPIMAQAPEEMAEIDALADALVLNTGTPSREKYEACMLAGITANRRGIPVILDPVGVGSIPWRRSNVLRLLETVRPAILRTNYGEARGLLDAAGLERGVDSPLPKQADAAQLAGCLAEKFDCTVLLSGNVDVIADARRQTTVSGGSALIRQITGAGCMLSALCGAFAAVAPPFEAAAAAAELWKQTAEFAQRQAGNAGLGSFRVALFDGISRVTDDSEEQGQFINQPQQLR